MGQAAGYNRQGLICGAAGTITRPENWEGKNNKRSFVIIGDQLVFKERHASAGGAATTTFKRATSARFGRGGRVNEARPRHLGKDQS